MNEIIFELKADESTFPCSICMKETEPVENCKVFCNFYNLDDMERYDLLLDFKSFLKRKRN